MVGAVIRIGKGLIQHEASLHTAGNNYDVGMGVGFHPSSIEGGTEMLIHAGKEGSPHKVTYPEEGGRVMVTAVVDGDEAQTRVEKIRGHHDGNAGVVEDVLERVVDDESEAIFQAQRKQP